MRGKYPRFLILLPAKYKEFRILSPHSELTKFRPLWNMQFESKVLEDYNPYQNQHNGDLQGYHNIIIIASNAPVWTRVN